MAASNGQVTKVALKFQRDARQVAGLATLGAIGLFVAIALGATIVAGWQGEWTKGLASANQVALFTLWQALLSLLLSLCLAVPVALALDNLPSFFGRRLILLIFTIPLALPVIVAIMALLALLGRNGMMSQISQILGLEWKPDIYGLKGILIAHAFFNMPLAVRIILQRFQAIPPEQWKLAESLQFNAWHRFRTLHVAALHALLPGLSGLIFLLCVGSYSIILVLGGGPKTTTLQVAIYQAMSFDFDLARAAMLTLVQLTITVTLLLALPNLPIIHLHNQLGTRRYHHITALIKKISALVIALGGTFVALPLVTVIVAGLNTNHRKLLSDPHLWQALATSATIGLMSALLAVSAAWALSAASYSYEKTRTSIAPALLRSVPLALLAIPSLVLGVGWFLFVMKTGLPLTIAPVLIVLANAMMALPFAMQIIQPHLREHFYTNDRLASSLGLRGSTRFWLVDLPIMRRALITAGLFAFALSLGDLGVVTLFGTDQIVTLPALIFQKMGSYRSNDAAGLALYLAFLTGLITHLALKAERNDRT